MIKSQIKLEGKKSKSLYLLNLWIWYISVNTHNELEKSGVNYYALEVHYIHILSEIKVY